MIPLLENKDCCPALIEGKSFEVMNLGGLAHFPFNELRLPHPSRFSKGGQQKLGDELFPVSDPQLRGALFIH